MRLIPHGIKYRIISKWHLRHSAFKYVKEGYSIIQIGASGRLCELGRSQPVIYSILVGSNGVVNVFEVLPENILGLNEYFEKYRIKNIKCHNIGVWKEPDAIEFIAPYRMATGSMIKEVIPDVADKFDTSRKFKVDSIDNLVKDNGIEKVDLINITINGAEPEAIEGGKNTIISHRPKIFMRYPVEREERVKKYLKDLGYNIHDDYMRLYFISGKFRVLWAEYNF